MKIYVHEPVYIIQLAFKRDNEKMAFLSLCDTTMELTKAMLESLFPKNSVRKDKAKNKTRIEIRERIGGKNGKYLAHSFYGDSPIKTRKIVFEYVSRLNSRKNTK